MSVLLRAFIFAAGLLLILITIRSLIRRGFSERQSLFWIFCGLVLMFIGAFPTVAYLIADVFSVDYVPSIFFALAIILAMYGIFINFKAISELQNRVQELAMQVSLLNQENKLLREKGQRTGMAEICEKQPPQASEKEA